MKLTANERRALAEFKKKRVDWNKVHGKTLHSLQRKKLIKSGGKGQSWRLTSAGLAELAVPDVFAELFVRDISKPLAKISWRWDTTSSSWWATHPRTGAMLRVRFNKVGGRHSGKKNGRSFWKGSIDGRSVIHGYDPETLVGGIDKWTTSKEAIAAVEHEANLEGGWQ